MNKLFTFLSIMMLGIASSYSQIVINEIMYNPPESGSDSTEFIELYNNGAVPVDLNGWSFSNGVIYTFPAVTVEAGDYLVVCVDSMAMVNTFGLSGCYEWTSGGLSNGGEAITIIDDAFVQIDSVRYDDVAPWPTEPDGNGPSIELCDASSDNAEGSNWIASTTGTGVIVAGNEILATPGAANSSCDPAPANVVITEIMYNNPGVDTLEFVELFNNSDSELNLEGFTFTDNDGTTATFTADHSIPAMGYFVMAVDSALFEAALGIVPDVDLSSGISLSNSGDALTLHDNTGVLLDSVFYEDGGAWPAEADGAGPSLELCSVDSNNNVGNFWLPSVNELIPTIFGTPGTANSVTCVEEEPYPVYMISEVDGIDADGVADSLGLNCQLHGIVHCIDFRGGTGLEFTIVESSTSNIGIKVFSFDDIDGYVVTEGDSVRVAGNVTQFNGYLQFNPDEIEVLATGLPTVMPTVVTALDESTENKLVSVEGLTLVDPAEWTGAGGGFNVNATDGVNTFLMRIDNESYLYSEPAPEGTFDITGLGGQFDTTTPYDEGYQIYPCGLTLDDPVEEPELPVYMISEIDGIDADGVADSVGVDCEIHGVVHCIDFRGGTGLEFTVIESSASNVGIKIFAFDDVDDYVVTEGDSLLLQGTVAQFNGQLQFNPDSIAVLATAIATTTPDVVTALNESTENKLIAIEDLTLVDPAEWTGAGSGFNVNVTDGTNNYLMRIDNESYLYDEPAPTGTFDVTGLGGQYDNELPYDEGYQIFPCGLTITDPGTPVEIPVYMISEIDGIDADGVADSSGVNCQIHGVVHCGDFRGDTGLEFTVIESSTSNVGIKIFAFDDVDDYVVTEGDSLTLIGNVTQFNGHLQFNPDSIAVLATDVATTTPEVVTALNESTENKLITIENLTLVDATQWTGTGSGFNVDVTDGTNTFVMRIDNDTYLYGEAAPEESFDVTGLGGQFDNASPYNEGYQIYPCSLTEDGSSTDGLEENEAAVIGFFPNPATTHFDIVLATAQVGTVKIIGMTGQVISSTTFSGDRIQLDITDLENGIYPVIIQVGESQVVQKLIKQ